MFFSLLSVCPQENHGPFNNDYSVKNDAHKKPGLSTQYRIRYSIEQRGRIFCQHRFWGSAFHPKVSLHTKSGKIAPQLHGRSYVAKSNYRTDSKIISRNAPQAYALREILFEANAPQRLRKQPAQWPTRVPISELNRNSAANSGYLRKFQTSIAPSIFEMRKI